jgi:hypothetical protein
MAFDGGGAVAVAADAERIFAGDFHQIGGFPEDAGYLLVFHPKSILAWRRGPCRVPRVNTRVPPDTHRTRNQRIALAPAPAFRRVHEYAVAVEILSGAGGAVGGGRRSAGAGDAAGGAAHRGEHSGSRSWRWWKTAAWRRSIRWRWARPPRPARRAATRWPRGFRIPPGTGRAKWCLRARRNPLGPRWIGLSRKGYGIHGTSNPRSIGRPGVARLHPHA